MLVLIITVIFGILSITKAKVKLTERTIIIGTPARKIGVALILTYPLIQILSFCSGFIWATLNFQQGLPNYFNWILPFTSYAIITSYIFFIIYKEKKAPYNQP